MRKIPIAIAMFTSLLLTGCPWDNESGPSATSVATPKSALAQTPFSDCAGYREYYADALAREYLEGSWYGVPCWGCEVGPAASGAPSPAEGAAAANDASGAPASASFEVSQTNTQEAGVDEEDLIEADGDTGRFYLLRGHGHSELLTVDAVPAETMAITARDGTGDTYATGLYLDAPNDRLVVVTNLGYWLMWDSAGHFTHGATQLLFFDLADPDHPVLTDRYEISGYLLGSRRVGSRLHLVTSTPAGLPRALAEDPSFFDLVYQKYYAAKQNGDEAGIERLAAEIRARIDGAVGDAPLDELLPVWRQGLDSVTAPQPLACDSVYHAQLDERLGLITISSIDTDGANLVHLGTINNTWQMYSSAANLYLTQGSGGWWWDPAQRQQTAIYRYAIGASGAASPAGHGVVDGWLHNSYGLSEHESYLRAATTEARFASDAWQRTNHLVVLDDDLEIAGQVRDFVRNETIFASRFLGDRGYVVTFQVIDPLFTFDLSNPMAPRLAGELEVPGVSTHLQPFGADHLVTIGRGTTPQGFFSGQVQLQLFDVADLGSPKVLDEALLGEEGQWAWSVAQYEPHAFTLFDDVLSIPAEISAQDYTQAFSGFVAYRVAVPGGFTEIGRIDHKQPDDGSGSGCPTTTDGSAAPCASFAPVIFNPPLRSVLVEEESRTVLYTLSNAFLRAHTVGDGLTEIATVPLKPPE